MEYWGDCLDGYAIQSISFVGGGLIQHQNCVPPLSFFNTTCNKKIGTIINMFIYTTIKRSMGGIV